MAQNLAISKTILSMAELQQRFGIVPSQDEQFFSEWSTDLPDFSAEATATLDQIKARFDRHIRFAAKI